MEHEAFLAFCQQRPYLPRFQIPQSEKNPHRGIRGKPDSEEHILGILGGCIDFTNMCVSRHDASLIMTMRILLKAVVKGAHGGIYIVADIGQADNGLRGG